MILDPGFNLTLRPMKYPVFYEMYKTGNYYTWGFLTFKIKSCNSIMNAIQHFL